VINVQAERDLPKMLQRSWLDADEAIMPFSRNKTFWQVSSSSSSLLLSSLELSDTQVYEP